MSLITNVLVKLIRKIDSVLFTSNTQINTSGITPKAVCRLADTSTGHGCFPVRANDSASLNVFVNGKGWHRQGDHWPTHTCVTSHDGVLSMGSQAVYVNGKQAGRVLDPISCGDIVATGSLNVFAG